MRVIGLVRSFMAAAAVSAFIATSANAITVVPDTLIGSVDLANSGDDTQLAALAAILGVDVNVLRVDNKFESGLIIQEDIAGNFYVDVSPEMPGWFALKFGTGGPASSYDNTWFFENIDDLSILAWSIGEPDGIPAGLWDCISGNEIGDDCRLSHITTVVPLPAGGLLLLTALGGLVVMRRRRSA